MYICIICIHFFMFVHITSVMKPLHIFMKRSRVSKSCLKAELCFRRFVYSIAHADNLRSIKRKSYISTRCNNNTEKESPKKLLNTSGLIKSQLPENSFLQRKNKVLI